MPLKVSPLPFDSIAVNQARAIVTTAWGNHGYRPLTITRVENYYAETALDSDADPWQLDIGDPEGDYLDTLERNNEVRVKIFGVGQRQGKLPVVTGIADGISYTTDGTLTLTGRDLSSLALDSTAPPQTYRQKKAWAIVQEQARSLGFTDTRLAKTGPEGNMVRKLLQTDGSESYWEFWYRLYRREKMWLWTEPDGTLLGDVLNYNGDPLYYFGSPRKKDPRSLNPYYIPIERLEVTKSTQSRVGSVWVYGQRGNSPIPPAFVEDPTMRHWLKKPRKIMLDSTVRSHREAIKVAWEEIFEGKVGELELRLTIADPGFDIEQNQIAVLNLPDPGIGGEFFVVGSRRQVGPDGFLIEVRLREKQYAVTRRTPSDPVIKSTQGPNSPYSGSILSNKISQGVPNAPQDWMDYFVKAANKWHGPWDYNLYLATLLGICHIETNFQNERSNGWTGGSHIIWYPWKGGSQIVGGVPKSGAGLVDNNGRTRSEWEAAFANENWDGQQDIAVGPMQLLSRNLKRSADDLMKVNFHDQYAGGRWVPEYNIMVAGEYVRSNLKQVAHDSGRDIDIWLGVAAYYGGTGGYTTQAAQAYANRVKSAVMIDPGYLQIITAARQASQTQQDANSKEPLVNVTPGQADKTGLPVNSSTALRQLTNLQIPSSVDVKHVDYQLLRNLDALATNLGKKIALTSGYRPTGQSFDGPGAAAQYGGAPGGDTQWYLYNVYKGSGFNQAHIAAFPGTSNHEKGEACDCTIGGIPIKRAVSASLMAQYGIHGTVDGDWPHVTLLSVRG